ncbi:MAG: M14 family zinc carboxypeptidase [candidate division Zixibacteria bacterium]|nr:M14 family zinc carboxypeptidase [candidate division Zixibacteria bacterium]MDH3937508.1 M14 family zinc carboxypeptidase [candidate division Zixibacteria bacterium]MDH4034420.1 M14 family zinc carboxypeptidase [candidate division Zixibacteria bacterium]
MRLRENCILTFVMAALTVANPAPETASADPYGNMKADTSSLLRGDTFDSSIPKPNDHLTHPVGARPARYHEITGYFQLLAQQSDRVRLDVHDRTHEGRDLYHLVISSAENLAHLDEISSTLKAISMGEGTFEVDAFENQVVCAWMGYGIHGDETSGPDAAVQLAYQLAAGQDEATMKILDRVIVIIDAMQNPDGRERFLSMLTSYGSSTPNFNPRSLQHNGVWPWGRGNHYLFDLNRDWILVTQPESRGKLATVLKYSPQLVVDGHEMGANATYLFDPPREPIHYNTADNVRKWWRIFAGDLATAFDQHGWPYYIEDWHDQWYPGYGSSWATFSGGVCMLYEQAQVGFGAIKQRDGYHLTYHEAVNHQLTSSVTNLTTLADNHSQILTDYHQTRIAITEQGQKSRLTYVIPPDDDVRKTNRFVSALLSQGIKVERSTESFSLTGAKGVYGSHKDKQLFPAGTYIVRTAQPMGGLANAILEFDPHLDQTFLNEERKELEKHGETRMYEVSTWSLPLAFDLEAWSTTAPLKVATELTEKVASPPVGVVVNPDAQFGFIVPMTGERTRRLLVRLFDEQLIVYASEKPFEIDETKYKSGTLVLRRRGNPENLPEILNRLAAQTGAMILGVNTGRTSKGSWLGATTFRLLARPKVGILTGNGINFYSFGTLWHTLDQELGIDHSVIDVATLTQTDLSGYNLIVLPSSWGRGLHRQLGKQGADALNGWMNSGGTLICTGGAAAWAADTAIGLSGARMRRQVLDQLPQFVVDLQRQTAAEAPQVDTMALWHPDKVAPEETKAEDKGAPSMDQKMREDHDQWVRRFRPRGVYLRGVVDTEDWLAFGVNEKLPVLVSTDVALMTGSSVTTPVRYAAAGDVRLSGLLWPEARQRWASTAWATRETKGKGQLIMFATDPNFRAYNWGTRALFVNAVLYGPGMGSRTEPYRR